MATNKGENITRALQVLLETYSSIERLLVEMEKEAEKAGFVSHTARFIRWKSDVDSSGWLVKSFIKLYQSADAPEANNVSGLKMGDMYAVDIDLEHEYPQIWIERHRFETSGWTRLPSTSEHWLFAHPFYSDTELFDVTESEGLWYSTPSVRARKSYWEIRGSVADTIPLVQVVSAETIQSEIFERMRSLPEPC